MPTVPPRCIPRSRLEDESAVSSLLPGQIPLASSPGASGPTPDPDLDDMLLVSGDGVGAVSSISQDNPPDHIASDLKPRINLSEISFHSPSSIIGTPFDISPPRFEYPFPPSEPELSMHPMHSMSSHSSIPSITSPLSHFSASYLPPAPPMILSTPLPLTRSPNTHSTHLKLHAKISKEPPVPPGLVKKRWNIKMDVDTTFQNISPVSPHSHTSPRPRTRARSSSESVTRVEAKESGNRSMSAERANASTTRASRERSARTADPN